VHAAELDGSFYIPMVEWRRQGIMAAVAAIFDGECQRLGCGGGRQGRHAWAPWPDQGPLGPDLGHAGLAVMLAVACGAFLLRAGVGH
jgi:hypothetical protein